VRISTDGHVHAINVSNGGVPKRSVPHVKITSSGLAGDRQEDLEHHGGPDRAVSLWSLEVIETLQREGHPIAPGSAGENITVAGVDWNLVEPDARIEIGDSVLVEVTRFAKPCKTIQHNFADGRFKRIAHERHPGSSRVYARVLTEGEVREGDVVRVRNR
jgi:MOSC domain-containing protein YiiM